MIAADSNGRAADAAARITGVAGVASTGVTGVAGVPTAVTTTAATALSFPTIAFSVPVAMHLSRYGRLPSWNKSRTQCLVIFHSTMKEISTIVIRCNLPRALICTRSIYEIILKFEIRRENYFVKIFF